MCINLDGECNNKSLTAVDLEGTLFGADHRISPRTVDTLGGRTLEQGRITEEFGHSDVLKLYVRSPQFAGGKLQRKLMPVVAGQAEISTSGAPFVELTAGVGLQVDVLYQLFSDSY